MVIMRLMTVLLLVLLWLPAAASAQAGSVEWLDIDCAQSRIGPTDGLRCRATDKLTSDALSTGEGLYRFWSASGSVEDTKYYYYVVEALSAKAAIVVNQSFNSVAKSSVAFGNREVMTMPAANYVVVRHAGYNLLHGGGTFDGRWGDARCPCR